MKLYKFKSPLFILAFLCIAIISCKESPKSKTVEETMSSDALEALSKQETIKITLNSNDRMQFDKKSITVFEGQTVILTLNHTGSMPITAMGHNFVLIENDISVSEFARLVLSEKDNEYIPTDLKGVIAHTTLIGGGESTTVTFKAPQKGVYDFLCSFPGHSSLMKGKFNVK